MSPRFCGVRHSKERAVQLRRNYNGSGFRLRAEIHGAEIRSRFVTPSRPQSSSTELPPPTERGMRADDLPSLQMRKNREKNREFLASNSSVTEFCPKSANCGKQQGISRESVGFPTSHCHPGAYANHGKDSGKLTGKDRAVHQIRVCSKAVHRHRPPVPASTETTGAAASTT